MNWGDLVLVLAGVLAGATAGVVIDDVLTDIEVNQRAEEAEDYYRELRERRERERGA